MMGIVGARIACYDQVLRVQAKFHPETHVNSLFKNLKMTENVKKVKKKRLKTYYNLGNDFGLAEWFEEEGKKVGERED